MRESEKERKGEGEESRKREIMKVTVKNQGKKEKEMSRRKEQ